MDRNVHNKGIRDRTSEEGEYVPSAKGIKTTKNRGYTYMGWNIPHHGGKSGPCRRKKLEEARF